MEFWVSADIVLDLHPNQDSIELADAVPRHVAIIMDGNHRWARQNRVPGALGHRAGARNVRPVVEACADAGVQCVTLFAFSTENWSRPPHEVELLLTLVRETLNRDLEALNDRDAQLVFIGDRYRFPSDLQEMMRNSEKLTESNSTLKLVIALSYGGRWDLVSAAKRIAVHVAKGELDPGDLDEDRFEQYLSTAGIPGPDFCIRTGGDQRLSNFMLWDMAYTEFFFTDTYWPDFGKDELIEALYDYTQRKRRFGARRSKTLAQATN